MTAWQALADFHQAPAVEEPNRRTLPNRIALTDDDPESPNPEFHTIVAALADHPALATRLGLQRRFRLTIPPNLAGAVTIRAIPTHSAPISDYRPRTSCIAASGTLTLSGADGTASSPYLPLNDTDTFTAIDVDTDRSGLALFKWANQLNQAPRDQPPPALLPPALRSDGIFVAETGREQSLQLALTRAADLNADLAAGHDGSDITLNADDLWHGYRVDVLDDGSQHWYPLCQRQVTYTVPGGPALPVVNDEGYVSAGMAHRGTDEQPTGLVHESLFRWNGWSLVAPPPGQMLTATGKSPIRRRHRPWVSPTMPRSCPRPAACRRCATDAPTNYARAGSTWPDPASPSAPAPRPRYPAHRRCAITATTRCSHQ